MISLYDAALHEVYIALRMYKLRYRPTQRSITVTSTYCCAMSRNRKDISLAMSLTLIVSAPLFIVLV